MIAHWLNARALADKRDVGRDIQRNSPVPRLDGEGRRAGAEQSKVMVAAARDGDDVGKIRRGRNQSRTIVSAKFQNRPVVAQQNAVIGSCGYGDDIADTS